jgi:type IV secretion system protein VirB5
MRTLLLAGVGLLALSGSARAQVSVVDWTGLAQAIKDYTLQAQQYATQGQQLLTETTTLAAFVHAPNMGGAMGLLNQAGLGNSLPVNPSAVMGLVSGVNYGVGGLPQIQGILGSLSGFASSAYATNHVYTPTDGSFASKETIANANSIAGYQGAAQASVADYQAHQAAFQALEARLQTATEPKDVQDIQAQIALQQAWFANEAGQQQAITAAYQAQRDADAERGHESITHSYDNFLASAKSQGDGF